MSKGIWNSCNFPQGMRSNIQPFGCSHAMRTNGSLATFNKQGKKRVECWDCMRFPSALRKACNRTGQDHQDRWSNGQFLPSVTLIVVIILSNRTNAKLHRYADVNSTFVGFPCVLCLHPSRTGKLQCDSVKVDIFFKEKTHISCGKDKNHKECQNQNPMPASKIRPHKNTANASVSGCIPM